MIKFFSVAPKFLGARLDVDVYTRDGRQFSQLEGTEVEVVLAKTADLSEFSTLEA